MAENKNKTGTNRTGESSEDIVMPSMVEVIGLLDITKALDIKKIIKDHAQQYNKYINEYSVPNAPHIFIGFVIPLDSYLPLPEGYGADTIYPQKGVVALSSINSVVLTIKLGVNTVKTNMSVIIAAIGKANYSPSKIKIDKKLMKIYRESLSVANNVLVAYKLTPERHNHELKPVNIFNRPSMIDVICFDTKTGDVIDEQKVMATQNILASTLHSRMLNESELTNFRNIHVTLGNSSWLVSNILSKIYQAMDANCVGDCAHALTLADTYAEHLMRYILFQIYLLEMEADTAGSILDDIRRMNKLLTKLAAKLGLTMKSLMKEISYDEWYVTCRERRNNLTHNFNNPDIEPEEVRFALQATIKMTTALTKIVEDKYPESSFDMTYFRSPEWYMNHTKPKTRDRGDLKRKKNKVL